jgi:stage III sporulation protein AG
MDAKELKSIPNEILRKYVNNKSLVIIIIIGIVFMLFSGTKPEKQEITAQNNDAYTDEARLGEILSKIDGVGKVHVMITYYGTTTSDIAFEKKQNISCSEDETVKSEETSVVTSGSEPLVKGIVYPKAKGVVVIAEGAGNVQVKKNITDAVVAALDIASFKVCVLEGKE